MAHKKIETIILEKISPYGLSEKDKAKVAQLVRQYSYELLVECIDISACNYLIYDATALLEKKSVDNFINKLGGIAYNLSLSPIERELSYIKNIVKKNCLSWYDEKKATVILEKYVNALQKTGYDESTVVNDLHTEMKKMSSSVRNWSDWYNAVLAWIDDINHWKDEGTIGQLGTILPDSLFCSLPNNIQTVCKQINASYENNLYDCTAVMMRRLLEGLLVQTYQNYGIEEEITDNKSGYHFMLDKIIRNAESNVSLSLSANTKKDLSLFKDLGNYSAHKIWYNCTKKDLEPHILKYRVIVEELLHKAGMN